MFDIKKKYLVDESNKKLAVEINIKTFEQIENILENHALYHLMKETEKDTSFNISQAKNYYNSLINK